MKFLDLLNHILVGFFLFNGIISFGQSITYWESPWFEMRIGIEKTRNQLKVDYFKERSQEKIFKRIKANHYQSEDNHLVIFKSENQLELQTNDGDRVNLYRLLQENKNHMNEGNLRMQGKLPSFKNDDVELMSQKLPSFLARELDEIVFIEFEQSYLFVYRKGYAPTLYNRKIGKTNIFVNEAGHYLKQISTNDFQWTNSTTNEKINLQLQSKP